MKMIGKYVLGKHSRSTHDEEPAEKNYFKNSERRPVGLRNKSQSFIWLVLMDL